MATTRLSKTVNWANYQGTSNQYKVTVTITESDVDSTAIANNQTTITATATVTCNGSQWQGGSSTNRTMTVTYGGTTIASGSFTDLYNYTSQSVSGSKTITHGSDGSASGSVVCTIGGPSTYYSSPATGTVGTWTISLATIPRQATLSSAPDFTDEENPTITYSNPAGDSVTSLQACIATLGTDGVWYSDAVGYRDVTPTATSYTFNLTDDERTALRKKATATDNLSVKYFLRTTFDSTSLNSTAAATMNVVNCTPEVSGSILETDSNVISLLGTDDCQTIIKGVSDVQLTVTPSVKKEATVASYALSNGSNSSTTTPYTFTDIVNSTIQYSITDSRSKTASGSIDFTGDDYNWVDYIPVSVSYCDFDRASLDDNTVILNATINYYNGSFTDSIENEPTITYSSTNGRSGTIETYVINNDNTIVIDNLEIGETLSSGEIDTFTLLVTDKLTSDSASTKMLNPIPTFDAGETDVQINGTLYIADTNRENAVDVGAALATIPTVYVQSDEPSSGKNGDIWFSV